AQTQLEKEPVKAVTLLGESLVLYRDLGGQLGLLAEPCMHRRASLAYGIPEARGLRCPYHGWLYAEDGQCLEQPAEPALRSFADRIRTTAYPVQELGGLIFAYLGELPAPTLPRYNVLAWDHAIRETQGSVIAANWLQVVENVLDPAHVEFLHGRFFSYYLERQDRAKAEEFRRRYAPGHVQRIAFDRFEAGILERHLVRSEIEPSWRRGSATFFPSTVMAGTEQDASLTFLVPLDDTHTWFLMHMAERPGTPLPPQKSIRFREVPGVGTDGRFVLEMANGQDHMATVTQGPVTRRDLEHLGAADLGLVLYRELLAEQLEGSERGDDPINVRRNSSEGMIDFPRRSRSPQPLTHPTINSYSDSRI
ncbi:MAG TPA: Rieske 2Fe-2S domain-containing protein, partial [Chloroflexota bacterium]